MPAPDLKPHIVGEGDVETTGDSGFRFSIPPGGSDSYRLAQLDDYALKARRAFDHRPQLRMSLQARVSGHPLPGTWGFGLWNDPFSISLGHGGGKLLPALPQAAWFFHASEPNWLSLHPDIPGGGLFAGVIRSPRVPVWLFAPMLVGLPLLVLKPGVRLARWLAGRLIQQAGEPVNIDPTEWHHYQLDWAEESVRFIVDGKYFLKSDFSPTAPLGLVIWIDNQYARLTAQGEVGFGTLANERGCWLEIKNLVVE